ncbi:MAG: aldo/keto reductase [Vampirovibrionia bacterium]
MVSNVKKIELGKTGLMVSKLCYGTLAIGPYHSNLSVDAGAELLVEAYRNGINFWDTAELYETYPHILEALKRLGFPEDLVIASRSYARTYEEMNEAIDKTLRGLNLSSIPVFGLHEMDGRKDFEESEGAFEALKEAKESGTIKNIAITMHSVESVYVAGNEDFVDIVFPLYNKRGLGIKHGNADDMSEAIKYAYDKGKGIYAMKVLAGGHLVSDAEESIMYVLNNNTVHSIAIGMDNLDELYMNLALFNSEDEEVKTYKQRVKQYKRSIQVDPWCEGCGECIKICPNNAITLEFSQAKIDHTKCILCGYCASACKYFCLKVVNTL